MDCCDGGVGYGMWNIFYDVNDGWFDWYCNLYVGGV